MFEPGTYTRAFGTGFPALVVNRPVTVTVLLACAEARQAVKAISATADSSALILNIFAPCFRLHYEYAQLSNPVAGKGWSSRMEKNLSLRKHRAQKSLHCRSSAG